MTKQSKKTAVAEPKREAVKGVRFPVLTKELLPDSTGKITSVGHHTYSIDLDTQGIQRILSICDGTVSKTDVQALKGRIIKIDCNDGHQALYAHLSGYSANLYQTVKKGDLIAWTGGEAESYIEQETTGTHLHFELWKDGKQVALNDSNVKVMPEPKPVVKIETPTTKTCTAKDEVEQYVLDTWGGDCTALAVARAEHRGYSLKGYTLKQLCDHDGDNGHSYGLFQINFVHFKTKGFKWTVDDLHNCYTNIDVAKTWVYDRRGNFTAWSVFKDNKYLNFFY